VSALSSDWRKKGRRGFRGYPVATVAYYGPDATRVTKAVVGVILAEGDEPTALARWHSAESDGRVDQEICRADPCRENGCAESWDHWLPTRTLSGMNARRARTGQTRMVGPENPFGELRVVHVQLRAPADALRARLIAHARPQATGERCSTAVS
jgi:hypothetical protein